MDDLALIRVSGQRWPAVILFTLVFIGVVALTASHGLHVGLYGLVAATLLGGKLLLSLAPVRRYPVRPPLRRTCLVLPMYNEDPGILRRALASIDAQDLQPNYVVIVDDGSSDPAAYEAALEWASTRRHVTVLKQDGNQGKREALARGFTLMARYVDVWICVDSDTVLDPSAIREGLRPFCDTRVTAVTGTVLALNPQKSLLARLIDLRYANAFLYERAAYSRLGAVLCCCGSLAMYRADIVSAHLDDFLDQRFLGVKQVYGDDRRLTNYALLHGRVVHARNAIARTAVPERPGHFVRQQIRWGKSFFRESLWVIRSMRPTRIAWWLTAIELGSWGGFTLAMLLAIYLSPVLHQPRNLPLYVGWMCLAGWARSVHVFTVSRPDWSRKQQFASFLLAPVYGGLHLLVLLPLRLYSLATLRTGSWGTRSGGAEVTD